ncbi:MAG: hypothetical protein AB7O60_03230 [Variibacter sp.]
MTFGRVFRAILLLVAVAAGAVYFGLVQDGTLPPLDVRAMGEALSPALSGTAAIVAGAVLVFVLVCTAIAPILYAIRSGDALTIIVSLVLTTAALAALVSSRTVFDMVISALLYMANLTLSAIVFATSRITAERPSLERRAPP